MSVTPTSLSLATPRLLRLLSVALAMLPLLALKPALAQPNPAALNDTGIIICYGPNSPCDPALHFKQDAMVGRDAAARSAGSGLVTNTGKGFSFTKISGAGADLPIDRALGDAPNDWACTRDNVTGLIWEIKSASPSHVRYKQNTYTWYNPDPAKNGGNPGLQNGGTCSVAGRCDTDKYIQDLQGTNLCGKVNWRLPVPKQVQNLFDMGYPVAYQVFVPAFFPNAAVGGGCGSNCAQVIWTSVLDASSSGYAWYLETSAGQVGRWPKTSAAAIMAVAGP